MTAEETIRVEIQFHSVQTLQVHGRCSYRRKVFLPKELVEFMTDDAPFLMFYACSTCREKMKSLLKTDRMALRTKIEVAFTEALEMDGSNADRGMTPSQRINLIRGELITTRNKLCAELESKRETR